jgi:hypothetical protein
MYSITENIYYSQLSSVTILLQPEPNCFTSYNTRKWLCFLTLCAIVFRSLPASHVSTCNGQRSSQLFCVQYTPGAHCQCGLFCEQSSGKYLMLNVKFTLCYWSHKIRSKWTLSDGTFLLMAVTGNTTELLGVAAVPRGCPHSRSPRFEPRPGYLLCLLRFWFSSVSTVGCHFSALKQPKAAFQIISSPFIATRKVGWK